MIIPIGEIPVSTGGGMACTEVLTHDASSRDFAVWTDPQLGVTEVYYGDPFRNTVWRLLIDSNTQVLAADSLPLNYGVAWLVKDFDRDGERELVIQRGGSFLDFHSVSDWSLRQRFQFPGMDVVWNPVAVNVDTDPFIEIFVTPHNFEDAIAVLVDYDPEADSFYISSNIPAPPATAGPPAFGDFDNDGNMEFISGNGAGYGLFECIEGELTYIGQVGNPLWGSFATTCRPKLAGALHALLGHSASNGVYSYQLLEPSGNNTFNVSHVFSQQTGGMGIHPCRAADTDCDGLDELAMLFFPDAQSWRWDTLTEEFVLSCEWNMSSLGTFVKWHPMDLDWDFKPEWGPVNHQYRFRAYANSDCFDCDSASVCNAHRQPWACECHADPRCDGVLNILDVVAVIGAAFRGDFEPYDYDCTISRMDVDCSGACDVVDVVRVVNVTFRGNPPSAEFCDPSSE